MDLREALETLATLGGNLYPGQHVHREQAQVFNEASAVLSSRLADRLGDPTPGGELELVPADQAKPLALLDTLQDVLRGIVYDMARVEVFNQVHSIAKDALAARESAEEAAKHYAATKPLASRLLLLEDDLGVHTRPAGDAALWGQFEALCERMNESELRLGRVAEDVSANNELLVGSGDTPLLGRVAKLEASAAATLTDIGRMSTAEAWLQERLKELDADRPGNWKRLRERVAKLEHELGSDTRVRLEKLEQLQRDTDVALEREFGDIDKHGAKSITEQNARMEKLEARAKHAKRDLADRLDLHVDRLDALDKELESLDGPERLAQLERKLANLESSDFVLMGERVAELEAGQITVERVRSLERDSGLHTSASSRDPMWERVEKLEARADATLKDIGTMSTAEAWLQESLAKLEDRVAPLETAEKWRKSSGNRVGDICDRVAELEKVVEMHQHCNADAREQADKHNVKARASLCERIVKLERQGEELGQHPALT